MKSYMKQGWRIAVKHIYIIILLFLYQLIWGFFLYRYIESAVTPLLRRWPAEAPNGAAVPLFLSEAQFQLMKTGLADPFLWLLGGLLLARMLLSPLFNAGVLYSIHHARDDSGTRFFQGIKRSWKAVSVIYALQMLLSIIPAWWLLPKGLHILLSGDTLTEMGLRLIPGAALWLLWGVALHLLSLSLQIGAVSGSGSLKSLGNAVSRLFPFIAVTLAMWGLSLAAGLFATGMSLVWAGLFTLILHQGYSFIRTLLKVWTFAAQYECLQAKE